MGTVWMLIKRKLANSIMLQPYNGILYRYLKGLIHANNKKWPHHILEILEEK